MDIIRKFMGVCPQHDILWPELTGREHLEIFGRLKGIPRQNLQEHVERCLTIARLKNAADKLTSTYSGGMKRRLSVAIASLGDPKIIFLDEPTSGMDPMNRRHVWDMVQSLKANRVIVLTTHSMEEAEILSDKVAIMALGRLRAVGDLLHLKTRFGSGYHINLLTETEHVDQVKSSVQKLLSAIKLDVETAGNLSYSLPHSTLQEITSFFQFMETPNNLIKDWAISHTTLEEVFIRVTHGGSANSTGVLSINEQTGPRQLNIAVEELSSVGTSMAPSTTRLIGFITINEQTTLQEARELIFESIENEPILQTGFSFLSRGVIVASKMEQSLKASGFLPLLILRPTIIHQDKVQVVVDDEPAKLKQEITTLQQKIADLENRLQAETKLRMQYEHQLNKV